MMIPRASMGAVSRAHVSFGDGHDEEGKPRPYGLEQPLLPHFASHSFPTGKKTV